MNAASRRLTSKLIPVLSVTLTALSPRRGCNGP